MKQPSSCAKHHMRMAELKDQSPTALCRTTLQLYLHLTTHVDYFTRLRMIAHRDPLDKLLANVGCQAMNFCCVHMETQH